MEPEIYEIQVVDMFGESLQTQENFGLIFGTETSNVDVKLDPRGNGVVPALILAQLIPCAPYAPTVAVKARVLEAYRVAHVRCPHLAIQSFVKALCDLHGVRLSGRLLYSGGLANLHNRFRIDRTYVNNSQSPTTCISTSAGVPMSVS
jgi:hypothetical protein